MSIKDLLEKIKLHAKALYMLVLMLVIASVFFALGKLYSLEETKTPIKITYPNTDQTGAVVEAVSQNISSSSPKVLPKQTIVPKTQSTQKISNQAGMVIGSKNGNKYYFPWCGTVKIIKPENQIKFASIADARSAGYLPASNCKGLK